MVLVHGFTQTGASWATIAAGLEGHDVVAPDQPGHGDRGAERADLVTSARLLAPLGPAAFVGYSMGARIALHLALLRPDLVSALVLLGGTAGIDDDEERAARRAADEVLADRLEDIGTEAFLDEWLAQPLFAGLPTEGRGARSTDAAGLAWSLRLSGTGTQQPLWDRLGELAMPVLVVAGERDEKFRALGDRLVAGIGGNAELALVAGAGHAAHLERPDGFLAVVRPWLAGLH
ncbi:MAG: alpha/beta hydrolase [Actinomycetia bacterium]|nr:alpha/beta hydrolase [Actinomycetes bacterium]